MSVKRQEDLPATRLERAARVGRLAAGQAARYAGTRAANLTRPPAQRAHMLERRHVQAAEQILAVLGTMKGPAMKVGQVLSFIDPGLLPEEVRPRFQAQLAALRDAAPAVPFGRMARVVEEDLGAPLSALFAEFEEVPVAAASIGQVHRARLGDGRIVAVKVQYPNIATAVRADIKNLRLLMRLAERMLPGIDPRALSAEIGDRLEEELDYELEASNQALAARDFEGHPFIVVPSVVAELCGPRVLVSEFADGIAFDAIEEQPADLRDRVGEIVYRFYCGSMYRLHRFSGDPHPGNLRLLADGRVAFVDFGFYKQMDPAVVDFELECQRLVEAGRYEDLRDALAEAGILPEPDRVELADIEAYALDVAGWFLYDDELTVAPELVTEALVQAATPASRHFASLRHQSLPPEHFVARRTELWTFGLLGRLGATANWHRIAREWLYGDEPATELGRLEAAFRAKAPRRPR
jgi:predicted unusual protein kinase regulating ubiquinone biosynthesis (AarF/ABC1/UbiB family)